MDDKLTAIEMSALFLLNAERELSPQKNTDVTKQLLLSFIAGDLNEADGKKMQALLANNAALYQEWFNLTELTLALNEANTYEHSVQKTSLLQRTAHWLNSNKLSWLIAPAFAVSLVFLIMPVQQPTLNIDSLYSQWKLGIDVSYAQANSEFRGTTHYSQKNKPLPQQWFEWGVYKGIKQFDGNLNITGLPRYKLPDTQPANGLDTGHNLALVGEMSVITYFYCQQTAPEKFLEDVLAITQSLGEIPQKWSMMPSINKFNHGVTGEQKSAICKKTNQLFKQLIQLNHEFKI